MILEDKTRVLLILSQDVVDRARVVAGKATVTLKLPVSLQIVMRALVQARVRQTILDQVVALGPAHFTRSRTGDVLVSMVEGVQQLEVYFGQYLPQLAVA